MTIILASGSPRRRALLERLTVPFEVIPSRVVERAPTPGEASEGYALELATDKADEVAGRFPGRLILAADTVVAIDGLILGKPRDAADARRMLSLLRGRWHEVVTAVVVRQDLVCRGAETARVRMRAYSDEEAAAYVETGEPMDKAGSYAVQGLGGDLVAGVRGCYETVVGLPLCLCRDLLLACGLREPLPAEPGCRHR